MQPQHHHVATHSCSPPPANSSRLRYTGRRGHPVCPSSIGRSANPSAGGVGPPAGRGPMAGGTAPGRDGAGRGRARRGGGAAAAGAGAGRAAAPAPWRPRPRPRGGRRRSAASPTTRTARKRGGSRGDAGGGGEGDSSAAAAGPHGPHRA